MKKLLTTCFRASILPLAAMATMPAAAGTLRVDPVQIEMPDERGVTSITVRNEEQTPVTVRAYALGWRQQNGQNVYDENPAVILSPPVFTMGGGQSQLVRIGLRNADAHRRAYRIILEEVPEANPAGGIRVAIRLDMPLVAQLEHRSESDLVWRAGRDNSGNWWLEATNAGPGYVRIDGAEAAARTGLAPGANIHFGAVLPGSSRRWTIGARPSVADPARFEAIAEGRIDEQPALANALD